MPRYCPFFAPIRRPGVASGKLVVWGIVLVAAVLAAITVWHHWSKGQASIAYWGASDGENIRYAPLVHLRQDQQSIDISQARGLVHFRQALIEDASFLGHHSKAIDAPHWEFEVVFTWPDQKVGTTVLFDLEKGLVGMDRKEDVLVAKPEPTTSGMRAFFGDLMKSPGD